MFKLERLDAICLAINSPGGSPVQAEIIASRIINLAKEKQLDVFGADLHSGIVSRISRGGLNSLNPIEKNILCLVRLPFERPQLNQIHGILLLHEVQIQ